MRFLLPVLLIAVLAGCTTEHPTQSSEAQPVPAPAKTQPAQQPSTPSFHLTAAAARPLPATLPPEIFEEPVVRNAYAIAKEIPEVLAQQPCYCFCDRSAGHKGLLDCFRDQHSSHCGVCMKEAMLAAKLHKEKYSAAEIRTAIIRGDWKTISLE